MRNANKSLFSIGFLAIILLVGVALAMDSDNDGMSDLYENFFKLNSTNSTDAAQNMDEDLLINSEEAAIWTDPRIGDTDADGFLDGVDSNALSRAVMMWGHPDFTSGNEYNYTGPDWWLNAEKAGGSWVDGSSWMVQTNAQASLYMDLDRTFLTNNLMMNLLHLNASNSVVTVNLLDTNGTVVVTNVVGDLTGNDGEDAVKRIEIPLENYPTASCIAINVQTTQEAYEIFGTTLYIDADGDGLDADQETQVGTLDTNSDFDSDGLTDYVEVFITHTLPTNSDTDNDGFSDGDEINVFGSDPAVPAWQEGGILGTLMVERWNSILGNQVSDLLKSDHFGKEPDERTWVSISEYAKNKGDSYGLRIRGTITIPVDGDYTFFLTGDDTAELWLSETSSPYQRKQILDLAGWTYYRQLSSWRVHASEAISFTSNQTCYVEILFKEDGGGDHVTLWWQRPGATEPEIVSSEYLRSYAQPADDQDMDGLPDALETAGGLDPTDGTGGGYLDTDGDGFSDHEEINFLGTSPSEPMWQDGGLPGTLMVERWDDIPGFHISDMLNSDRFGGVPDGVEWVSISEYSANSGGACGIRIRGTITAPTNGTYTFFLTGDDAAQVWLSETSSPYQRKKILNLAGWTGYRDLSNWQVQGSEPIILTSNQTCYVEILLKEGGGTDHVTLWWQRPDTTGPEIIGSEYLHSYIQPSDDLDGDALPDALEIAGGLDPLDGTGGGFLDTDNDGFSDFDEINSLGSSPTLPPWQDGGISGVLQVERWNGIQGNQVSDLVEYPRFGENPDELIWISSAEYTNNTWGDAGVRIRGTITAPIDGDYIFRITGDDTAEVWLSEDNSPYGRKKILDLDGWTGFRELSHFRVHPSESISLVSNQTYYVEILLKEVGEIDHLTLWWTRPDATEPEIIGTQYLHSYVQPTDDQDMDGLPDALETAGGLDPLDGSGGGHLDTDNDGFSDLVEIVDLGTPATIPMWQDGGISGTLLVERWNNIKGKTVADLVENPRFGSNSDESSLVTTTEYPRNCGDHFGIRMRGTLTAPIAGTYLFWLSGDDAAQVWLSNSESSFSRELILNLASYTSYRAPVNSNVHSVPVVLASNQTCYVEILLKEISGDDHVTLWWTRPGESAPEIIGSEYLNSYVQSPDDLDMDGLPDAWERANDLNPTNGIGGGFHDADGDLYDDFTEYRLGLPPAVADTDADGIKGGDEVTITHTDPANADTDADGIPDLIILNSINGADTYGRNNGHVSSQWTTAGTSVELSGLYYWVKNSYVLYNIDNPVAGMHQITVHASWPNGIPSSTGRARMLFSVDGYPVETVRADGTGTYTLYTPWLTVGVHQIKCEMLPSLSGNATGFKLDRLDLAAIDGADTDGDGIQDWMLERMSQDLDSDNDGILDLDEIALGTNPLNPDTDGDGLLDYDELHVYATDVSNADTDGDGISDGEEVLHALTNPLVADFGASSVLLEINGSSLVSSVCSWQVENTFVYARDRNGTLEYTLPIATNGNYVLEIEVTEHNAYALDSHFDLSITVDDTLIDRATVVIEQGEAGLLKVWLPNLEAGEHDVQLKWNNIYAGSSLQVNALRLLAYGGPDTNGNNQADWLDTRLQNLTGEVVSLQSSPVSPVCLEGTSQNHALVSVTADFVPANGTPQTPAAQKGLADGWYANVMLNPYATTTLGVDTAPGVESEEISVDWLETNVMTIPSNTTMTVRLNDALLLSAIPESTKKGKWDKWSKWGKRSRWGKWNKWSRWSRWNKKGSMILYIEGPSFSTNMVTLAGQPVPYIFEEAGTYTINGFYSKSRAVHFDENDPVNAYGFRSGHPSNGVYNNGNTATNLVPLIVNVVDAHFGTDPYVGDGVRKWACPSMPTNLVVSSDAGVGVTTRPINPVGTEFTLQLNSTQEQSLLARLFENGPVVDRATVHPFFFDIGNYWRLVTTYPDGNALAMMQISLSEVPEDLVIEMNVIISGTTFVDGSLSMTLTAADFNEEGVATYYMIRSGPHAGVCHKIIIKQGGEFVDAS